MGELGQYIQLILLSIASKTKFENKELREHLKTKSLICSFHFDVFLLYLLGGRAVGGT